MKSIKLLILLFLALPNSSLVGQTITVQNVPPEALRLVAEARTAETRGDWKAAEQGYLRAILLDPSWAEILVNLGVVYNREGKTDEAIDILKRAAEIKPGLVEAHLNLGVTYFKSARHRDAATSLRRAISIEP